MKVKKLQLQNYGRFDDLTMEFAPNGETKGNVTIIVGNNGAGKSQILQALATGFSWFVGGLTNAKTIKNHSNKFTFEWDFNYEADYISDKMVKNNKNYSILDLFFNDANSQINANMKFTHQSIVVLIVPNLGIIKIILKISLIIIETSLMTISTLTCL